ncbi:hypothetical protein HOLleu_28718 [Holothuria leucospilota]|uniref:Uncharacterized protein n=1 Tax=Holothuria leucospilota TaxID=206669 RepID=A0A9Q1BMP9_HOLLE|nr:hypothetical protein HOLleu_28718 [Holothuria leucospilota]
MTGPDGEEAIGWCSHSGAELYIGNFNGDRRDDLLCHDSGTGRKWVALANRQSNFSGRTSWEAGLGWCRHSTAEFHVGDFATIPVLARNGSSTPSFNLLSTRYSSKKQHCLLSFYLGTLQ